LKRYRKNRERRVSDAGVSLLLLYSSPTGAQPQRIISMAKTIPTKPIDRSAVTGRFVTPEYAVRHPRTTEHERVPVSNPKK
jgi:hypothetical protein